MLTLSYNLISIIDFIIRLVGYIGVVVGVILITFPLFKGIKRIRRRRKISKKDSRFEDIEFLKDLEKLIAVSLNTKYKGSVNIFFILSISLFIIMFLLLHQANIRYTNMIGLSLIFSLLPYIILRIKLHSVRVESSYEGEASVTELINQYKINHLNMLEAIEMSIARLSKQPYTKKAFQRLLNDLQKYKDKNELEESVNEFTYSIDTEWAMLVGNNIYLSIEYGDDVRESLDDVLDDLKDLNSINEKNKQQNNEAFFMVKYFTPFSYLFSLFVMFNYFGFTFTKYIDYQIRNEMGLQLFILTVASIVGNYMLYIVTKRPKNDF